MAIFGGFLILLSGLFVSTLEVQQESIDTARIEQDSHYLLTRLQYDVGQASTVVTPGSNGASSSTLVLNGPSGTQTFFAENEQLKMTMGSETNVLTSPDIRVTNLQFQRLGSATGNSSITINLTLENVTAATNNVEQRSYTYTVGLR